MDTQRMKRTAQWFYGTVFQEEALPLRPREPKEFLPPLLRAARSIEKGMGHSWQSREAIFIKQGKLLTDYEDDFVYDQPVVRYFPTYQALTDRELRGYFTWRTKLRRGQVEKTSLSYAFLYIYELINQIGVASPSEGYELLQNFARVYGELDKGIVLYLKQWLVDYAVYYQLPPALLTENPMVIRDQCITTLEQVKHREADAIMEAVHTLSPQWPGGSRFYKAHRQDMEAVIIRVLRRMSEHYATRCKNSFTRMYFGPCEPMPVQLFANAVFYNSGSQADREYRVSDRYIYRCKNSLWTLERHHRFGAYGKKLKDLMKTIDAVMRRCYDFGYPIRYSLKTGWALKCIEEETLALLEERKAVEARTITIDFSLLDCIRREAAITREALTVEEEMEEDLPPEEPEVLPQEQPVSEALPLNETGYRLLQCLLYGQDLDWIRREGLLMSVLVDEVNEALFDTFGDCVLEPEEPPAVVEDYTDELKERIKP